MIQGYPLNAYHNLKHPSSLLLLVNKPTRTLKHIIEKEIGRQESKIQT